MHALIAIYKVGRNWLKVILKNEPLGLKNVYMKSSKYILLAGACKQVNNGENILTWEDPWVLDLPNFKPVPLSPENQSTCLVVSQLLAPDKMRWDDQKLIILFTEVTVKAIKRILVKSANKGTNGYGLMGSTQWSQLTGWV